MIESTCHDFGLGVLDVVHFNLINYIYYTHLSTSLTNPVPEKFLGIVGQDPSDSEIAGYMLTSSGFSLFN